MKISSTRDLASLKPVLQNPTASGPDLVYWVFSGVTHEKWENLTVITDEKLGQEYPKTYGHYHGHPIGEIYHLIEGQGILILQKKYYENEKWIEDKVSEVILIKAQPGDEITITPEWGHSWSNVGNLPLLSYDDWREGHTERDYDVMEKLHGLAYYLIEKDGQVTPIPNPNYQNLPEPIWMSAEEFKAKTS